VTYEFFDAVCFCYLLDLYGVPETIRTSDLPLRSKQRNYSSGFHEYLRILISL
jgi:hypothetical protein